MKGDTVLIRRDGKSIVLEPIDDWPDDWVESFVGIADDFERLDQGATDPRETIR